MALCHLPNPSLYSSRQLQSFPCASGSAREHLRWDAERRPSCRALLLSCSARKSRTTKSNADLCNELREFVSAVGLPEHHVPSMKELLEHGRKDLAYIVRRRGYKEITKLLTNPTNGDTTRERDLANDNDFSKVSTHESMEGQETQDNVYSVPSDSLYEEATSCSQNGEVEIIGGNMGSQQSFPLTRGQHPSRDDVSSEEILNNLDFDENKASDLDGKKANQAEISHLKELLHQKEVELALLKQEIEEEKFALSIMQNKAQSEINGVQNIISTKNEELHAAEESLAGLKEVLIEYWGNGETVEVAGSFNGWQHRVKMDPNESSKTAIPTGTRETILWSTILWLYPGIYEIKFIVDGSWKIDHQREFVARGDMTNNILRVER